MPVHDDLGKRMKEFYEQVPKTRLVRRMPVAIIITGADVLPSGLVETKSIQRPHWVIDTEIPIFKGEDRNYIDKLVNVGCECQCCAKAAYIN